MESLENIINKTLENNSKQKMLTYDFKLGKKQFGCMARTRSS